MAMFREHISGGAVVAAAVVALVYFYALVTDPLMLSILFAATVVASFMPDLDSDSGLPFHLIFGTFTVFCGGGALYYALQYYPEPWYLLAGIPAVALLFVWFFVGGVFKQCTTHRGIMHSMPAAAIAGLAALLLVRYAGHTELEAVVFGIAMLAGYITHLVFDELYAFVDVQGLPFIPKRSLGTAMKFVSSSKAVTLSTYTILAALLYLVFQDADMYFFLLGLISSVSSML